MISAVFDACILYSASLRDFLLRHALSGLFSPRWSEEIHVEWMGHLLQNRQDLTREKLERTRREMESHFPQSLVRGYEFITPTLQLGFRRKVSFKFSGFDDDTPLFDSSSSFASL